MPFVRTSLPLAVAALAMGLVAVLLGVAGTDLTDYALASTGVVVGLGVLGMLRHWTEMGLVLMLGAPAMAAASFSDRFHPSWAAGLLAVVVLAHALRAEPLPAER